MEVIFTKIPIVLFPFDLQDYFASDSEYLLKIGETFTIHNSTIDVIWRCLIAVFLPFVSPVCLGDNLLVFHHGACEGMLIKHCDKG